MLVLSWNLYHGRALPPAHRDLYGDFAAKLGGWAWDAALLQECPPWWPAQLARDCGAQEHHALTARNACLPLRRFVATRWPDFIKSNGGGANAILLRGEAVPAQPPDHRFAVLRTRPERRVVHAVRLREGGWIANLHAQVWSEERAQADAATAAAHVLAWAGDAPVVLGGDFNTPAPHPAGLTDRGGHKVDRILTRGWTAKTPATTLEHGQLSDHAPVVIELLREGNTP
jgi:endonuclease/exonuclease/phosphatase family metal-dependent hydrolase